MRTPLVVTILVLLFSSCVKEIPVLPNTKTIVFNLIVPAEKPIHALSFKISFDPRIFELQAITGSSALFADGHIEIAKDDKANGLYFIILGQKGVHAPISGVGEVGRVTLKRLAEPSPQLAIIEGVGTAIFYESDGKRKLYSFRYKLAERLDNANDATVTLEIER